MITERSGCMPALLTLLLLSGLGLSFMLYMALHDAVHQVETEKQCRDQFGHKCKEST